MAHQLICGLITLLKYRQGAAASETLPMLVLLPVPPQEPGTMRRLRGTRLGGRKLFKWMRRDNYWQCRGNTRWLWNSTDVQMYARKNAIF